MRKRLWKHARNNKTDDSFEEWLFRKHHIPQGYGVLNPFENSVSLKNLWLQKGKNWLKGCSRQILKVMLTWATFLNIYNYFIVSSEQRSKSFIFMGTCCPNYLILHTLPTIYFLSSFLISLLPGDHESKKRCKMFTCLFLYCCCFHRVHLFQAELLVWHSVFPLWYHHYLGKKKKRQMTCCYVLWNQDTKNNINSATTICQTRLGWNHLFMTDTVLICNSGL